MLTHIKWNIIKIRIFEKRTKIFWHLKNKTRSVVSKANGIDLFVNMTMGDEIHVFELRIKTNVYDPHSF